MHNNIIITTHLGKDLRTRSFFRSDIERLIDKDYQDSILDFSGVEFISRSVADEICNLLIDYPSLSISGMEGDVKNMFELVVRGREEPREYPTLNAKVYHLKTFKEMHDFFEAI